MKYKLRLRGAETCFGYAWFFLPFPPRVADIFRYQGKMWEVKSVIYNVSEIDPKDVPIMHDDERYLTELTVESFPIV